MLVSTSLYVFLSSVGTSSSAGCALLVGWLYVGVTVTSSSLSSLAGSGCALYVSLYVSVSLCIAAEGSLAGRLDGWMDPGIWGWRRTSVHPIGCVYARARA